MKMDSKFAILRQELDELGYVQTLSPDSAPLVDRLFSDLKTTTENLKKYMKISQQALEERDTLQLGAEPYKCDNAKLIRECNELHFAFIQFREQHEKLQKNLKSQIATLEDQLKDCKLEKDKIKKQVTNFKTGPNNLEKKNAKFSKQPCVMNTKANSKSKGFQIDSAMACADEKIVFLTKEIKKLKQDQLESLENHEFLKNQLQNREEEICRLKGLLEGGRPAKAINKDCCYRNVDDKLGSLHDEISCLKKEKISLQNQLKEALAKQHEAMRRALHLAERNKQLEKELKDIDQIALAVEAECNSTVKTNMEKVTRLQDRMNESVIMIQNLERENLKLKQDKLELSADLDAIRLEKSRLQSLLETEIDDKKRLTDRINSFTIIEHDLNIEIDRLLRLSGEQKRKIAELESQVIAEKLSMDKQATKDSTQQRLSKDSTYSRNAFRDQNMLKKSIFSDKSIKSRQSIVKNVEHKKTCKKSLKTSDESAQSYKCCCETNSCVKNMKELLDKEIEFRQAQAMQQIESLKQEKDYYMKEYQRISEEMRNFTSQNRQDNNHLQADYEQTQKKLEETKKQIAELHEDVRILNQEKYVLMTRLDEQKLREDNFSELDGVCHKVGCKRKSREYDILQEECKHLEQENEILRHKIKSYNESTIFDQDRMKKAFLDMEQHIKKLEDERRSLTIGQCSSRSNVQQLEEELALLREQLKVTQTELNLQRANYAQLQTIHGQADRALSEAQSKVLRAQMEASKMQSKVTDSHRETQMQEKETERLQSDIQIMKAQLTKMDREKDELLNNLDDKTERMVDLENQLKEKKNIIQSLESELKDLKRKLSKLSDEGTQNEQILRTSRQEINLIQNNFDNERRLKESALLENRRLQSDLASVTCDCRDARNELEIAKRQVEDLKRQLQHYVAEVKRTEDLISQKELERSEVLDQYKSLSEEAIVLESNNHTLENEATQSRVQLSVALDHTSNLERKIENQDSIIRSYEKQIADLTSQVASLEIQMKQGGSQQNRIETNLNQIKDLCVKLDHEKDSLKRDLRGREEQIMQLERSVDRLSRENEELRRNLNKDHEDVESLEKLLNDARQELIEQRLLAQDLHADVPKLKKKIEELQDRLASTAEQLELYQDKTLEFSQQNKQLRKEIANKHFFRSKEDDFKRYPSL